MQFPNAKSDLLMLAPSRNLAPQLAVAAALSDPAKSMSAIFDILTSVEAPAFLSRCLR